MTMSFIINWYFLYLSKVINEYIQKVILFWKTLCIISDRVQDNQHCDFNARLCWATLLRDKNFAWVHKASCNDILKSFGDDQQHGFYCLQHIWCQIFVIQYEYVHTIKDRRSSGKRNVIIELTYYEFERLRLDSKWILYDKIDINFTKGTCLMLLHNSWCLFISNITAYTFGLKSLKIVLKHFELN